MRNLILSLFTLLFLTSCQNEEESLVQDTQATLTKESPLSALISRVAQNPTFKDNCIDDTSCFSVVLPVTLTINSQEITVNNEDDYELVKSIKNQNNTDDDIVHYAFPINIKYRNFQQVLVNDQSAYDALESACNSNDNFHEIKCIDFNYPVTINYYNTLTQVPGTITLSGDSQLFNFIAGLKSDDVYSVVFPLSMTLPNTGTVIFNSNAELQSGIENVINDCDEPNTTDPELSDILVEGSWYVSSFIENGDDETYEFNGYSFTFSPNGTVVAIKNAMPPTNGTWALYPDDGYTKLDLNFDGNALHDIEEDWRVIEYNATMIKLRHQSGGGGGTDYLTLTKI